MIQSTVCRFIDQRGAKRFEKIVTGANIKAQEFPDREFLSFDYMKAGARILCQMIEKSRFSPDFIVGVNNGGLIIAAAIHTIYQRPIGVAHMSGAGSDRQVGRIDLPYDYRTDSLQKFGDQEKFDLSNPESILGEYLADTEG